MGTRINLLFPHQLKDWTNREETLNVLEPVLPHGAAIEEYWQSVDPNPAKRAADVWEKGRPISPPGEDVWYYLYIGPGNLFVSVNPQVVHVRTSGRWRGFLSIQHLRTVHIPAFYAICKAFGAPSMRIFLDDDFVMDEFYDQQSYETCCRVLDQRLGAPVSLEEQVDPEIAAKAEHGCPMLQYIAMVE